MMLNLDIYMHTEYALMHYAYVKKWKWYLRYSEMRR